jgi:hypothetical protein
MQKYEKFLEYARKTNTNLKLNALNISYLECLHIKENMDQRVKIAG